MSSDGGSKLPDPQKDEEVGALPVADFVLTRIGCGPPWSIAPESH